MGVKEMIEKLDGMLKEMDNILEDRFWNSDKLFEGMSYRAAKKIMLQEREALEDMNSLLGCQLHSNSKITWKEYKAICFTNRSWHILKLGDLCTFYNSLVQAELAEPYKNQSEAS